MSNVKKNFMREVNKRNDELNLAYAALLMAEYLTTAIDTSLYLALLDEIAEQVQAQLKPTPPDLEVVRILNHHLFKALKFSGNIKRYYHPTNSFLNKVLDMRTGIPISLSVIYLEIGWRLGLPVWGINLPGHFMVGYGPESDPIYIDVFGQGRILSEDDCIGLAQGRLTNRQQIKSQYLKPTPKKSILYRMLLNLKQIYVSAENWENAYKVIDLMLAIYPGQANDLRDRGLIAYRLDRLREATMDLERYLFLKPHSPDAAWLKQHLEMMEEKLIRLN
jgi:regulator of sirC expression with transglutaminase-like and TPR domain